MLNFEEWCQNFGYSRSSWEAIAEYDRYVLKLRLRDDDPQEGEEGNSQDHDS